MTCISICPDQSQLGQVTISVVIALKANSARLMICPRFGQTWTLSQCLISSQSGASGVIDTFPEKLSSFFDVSSGRPPARRTVRRDHSTSVTCSSLIRVGRILLIDSWRRT